MTEIILKNQPMQLNLSNLAEQHAGLTVVVCKDMLSVIRLENEIPFFTSSCPIFTFPDWETLPYDNFSPHRDIISQRLMTLYSLPTLQKGILIVPITTLMQRLPPPHYLQSQCFILKKGDHFSIDAVRKRLEVGGYRAVSQVIAHGEFAVRGSLLDLFPMGSPLPYRIDLFDEEVDSIRTFDPESQRSSEPLSEIQLLPAHEFPLTPEAITLFRQKWREKFSGNPMLSPTYQDISQGMSPAGIEYYLPLFFEQTASLFDYLPSHTLFALVDDINQAADKFWKEVSDRYEERRHDISRPLLPPNELFIPPQDLLQKASTFEKIHLEMKTVSDFPNLTAHYKKGEITKAFGALETFMASHPERILFCAESLGRREILLEVFKTIPIHPTPYATWQEFIAGNDRLGITVAPLEEGFRLTVPPLSVITESQLLGQPVLQQRRRKTKEQDPEHIIRNLAELSVGAPVVHFEHGVGRYKGLKTLTINQVETEFLTLEYADENLLYVPVSSLHLISHYSGMDPEQAPLNRLGTEQWQKAKRKAAEQIRDVAAELLEIHAKRAARQGFTFDAPDEHYHAFEATFPFETTPDQQRAIDEVIRDMTQGKPMDRLVCGDVGFGKTEVAMRAAFLAVQSNKQVAILVPTTLLAQQHYQNFCDRFAQWPVKVDMVSRFRSQAEQTNIIKQLNEGKIDILIGTHKLLSENIKFSRLGLAIIDEEHRFGVRQKERLKSLRAEVDILTLTATPIPRTLNMALTSLRDLSIIATPPAKRLSIKTFVREYDKSHIREALLREIMRGGQVYYIHNDIETIEKTAQILQQLVPEARVVTAHGQMREHGLERIMADFYHHHNNVLVCTTIIETGIDVPTANTIIIERADKFGLAQLHQLRGRVGRSHHQAYAYLLTPPRNALSSDAVKRLDAIASLEDLGAGFTLATHDLEIRGAGELLGEEQSGNMQAIGFSLYMELLERAVAAMKAGKILDLEKIESSGAEIDLQIPALIPESYVPDVHIRLTLYKRIASAKDNAALDELQVEMIDRFGLLPEPTKNLFRVTQLKLRSTPLGIKKIDAGPKSGRIDFEKHPNINPKAIIQLIQTQPQHYKLEGSQRLKFFWQCEKVAERLSSLEQLLEMLDQAPRM